jgi:hypothetical protein
LQFVADDQLRQGCEKKLSGAGTTSVQRVESTGERGYLPMMGTELHEPLRVDRLLTVAQVADTFGVGIGVGVTLLADLIQKHSAEAVATAT